MSPDERQMLLVLASSFGFIAFSVLVLSVAGIA